MFVMSSTQKGAFSIYINAGVRTLACTRARPQARLKKGVQPPAGGVRGVRKALFSLASALRGAFFPSFLYAGVRAPRPFKANYEGTDHRGPARPRGAFAGVHARHSNIANSAF